MKKIKIIALLTILSLSASAQYSDLNKFSERDSLISSYNRKIKNRKSLKYAGFALTIIPPYIQGPIIAAVGSSSVNKYQNIVDDLKLV